MENKEIINWHLNIIEEIGSIFNKSQLGMALIDMKDEKRKKINLLFTFFPLQIQLIRGIWLRINDRNYYAEQILLCSLIESFIIREYLTLDDSALNTFLLFVTVEDLKNIDQQDDDSKQRILTTLKADYNKNSLEQLKKEKITFKNNHDYLNRRNYKNDWKQKSINEMYKTVVQYNDNESLYSELYSIYSKLCDYKHFNPQLLTYQSLEYSDSTLIDTKLSEYNSYRNKKELYKIYHYLCISELLLIKPIQSTPTSYFKVYSDIKKFNKYRDAIKKFDNSVRKIIETL